MVAVISYCFMINDWEEKLTNQIEQEYSIYKPIITQSQYELTNNVLGLDSKLNKKILKKYLIIENIRLIPYFVKIIFRKYLPLNN